MTSIYIDADACPMQNEVFQVADRRGLRALVVANGNRPLPRPRSLNAEFVLVEGDAGKADDSIAEHIGDGDVCVSEDIPLAARYLPADARAVSSRGRRWSEDNIGAALAGREVFRLLRQMGHETRHTPVENTDRSRFLVALDAALIERPRVAMARGPAGIMPGWDA